MNETMAMIKTGIRCEACKSELCKLCLFNGRCQDCMTSFSAYSSKTKRPIKKWRFDAWGWSPQPLRPEAFRDVGQVGAAGLQPPCSACRGV